MMKSASKDYTVHNRIAGIGVSLLLFLQPLFITNRYYNITVSKFLFFVVLSVVFFAASFIAKAVDGKRNGIRKDAFRLECEDYAWFVFVLFGAITLAVSDYKSEAFTGSRGRYLGFAFYLAAFAMYLFVAKCFALNENILLSFQCSTVLVILLALLEVFGADPFGLISTVPAQSRQMFLSTIGNIDVFASFLCVSLPIALYMIVHGRKHFVYYTVLILGTFALFASGSDSGYVGMFAVLWILCLLSFKNQQMLKRFCWVCVLFFAEAFIYGLLQSSEIINRPLSSLTYYLSRVGIVLTAIAFFTAISALLHFKELKPHTLMIFRTVFIIVSACGLIAIAVAVLYFSLINKDRDLGGMENYLRFSEQWGSERGHVWMTTLETFSELPLINKLFGYGQDTLYYALSDYSFEKMMSLGAGTDNAHNEIIQYLVTTGVAGVAAYLAVVLLSVKKIAANCRKDMLYGAILLSVAGYLAQSLVNISQPITTPLFFVMLAIGVSSKISGDKMRT